MSQDQVKSVKSWLLAYCVETKMAPRATIENSSTYRFNVGYFQIPPGFIKLIQLVSFVSHHVLKSNGLFQKALGVGCIYSSRPTLRNPGPGDWFLYIALSILLLTFLWCAMHFFIETTKKLPFSWIYLVSR